MSKQVLLNSLESHVASLALKLENDPDPWFGSPKGYMQKPPYNRPAQERVAIFKKTQFSTILSSGYKNRFFVLDIKGHKLHYFKSEDPNNPEQGCIDMLSIIDIKYSEVYDAPPNSIDLVSKDRHYTLVCDSLESMIRWAYACNLSLRQNKLLPVETQRFDIIYDHHQNIFEDDKTDVLPFRWSEFEVVYSSKKTPLMINVVGLMNRDKEGKFINNILSVTSFDFFPDGSYGTSETSGLVGVKDFLVKMNDQDLTKLPIKDALALLNSDEIWPKTIKFIRDNLGVRDGPRIEGWAFILTPGINRHKLRYVELVHDTLFFYKAEPGGAVSPSRDASFKIRQIARIVPTVNIKESKHPCSLELFCNSNSLLHFYDETTDECIGSINVPFLELHFAKVKQLNRWRSALVSPYLLGDGTTFRLSSEAVKTSEALL